MGIEIEAQDHTEVMQVRSRELQLENTEKLEQIIPVVQTIDEVDLQAMESNTNDIKDMIVTNIDNQTDLDKINEQLNRLTKGMTELKKANTRLTNSVKDLSETMQDFINNVNKIGDTNG